MDKTTTFSKQRFRRSFFSFGRTTAPIDTGRLSWLGGRSSGLGERPPNVNLVRLLAGRSIGSFGANDRLSLCFFFVGRIWAVDRLVLGERPATALLNFNFVVLGGRSPNFGERPALVLLWSLSLLPKSFVFVLLRLDFRASYQIICTFNKLVKTHKT